MDHLREKFPCDRFGDFSPSAREAYVLQEIDSLSYLFNSADVGFGDREPLLRLQPLLDARIAGALLIRRHTLPENVLASIPQFRDIGSAGESWTHHWLKRVAAAWLQGQGDDPRPEMPMFGGRVDVYGRKSRSIIEVGSTSYSRAIDALTGSSNGPFFIIPFSRRGRAALNTDPNDVTAFELFMSRRDRVRLRSAVIPSNNPPSVSGPTGENA